MMKLVKGKTKEALECETANSSSAFFASEARHSSPKESPQKPVESREIISREKPAEPAGAYGGAEVISGFR